MSHQFEIYHAQAFPLELGRAPKKVRNAYQRTVIPTLQDVPDVADPSHHIRRLSGYKDLWRLRVSDDYRLVYHVDHNQRTVTMLMLDHRTNIYRRLGANDNGEPGIRIVARAEELLERKPTSDESSQAELAFVTEKEKPASAPDQLLPEPLDPLKLTSWGIPIKYHQELQTVRTEGELLGLTASVPQEVLERIINGLWPPNIEEVTQQPVRMTTEYSSIEAAADGHQSIESFLLKLDNSQKIFVARFTENLPEGPWLLKGGPGSGKSTVALYCIRSLVRGEDAKLPFVADKPPLHILFTTFTKSLVNASRQMLKTLGVYDSKHKIDVKNVDSIAYDYLSKDWKNLKIGSTQQYPQYMKTALDECRKADPKLYFSNKDVHFLLEEINWVVVGQGCMSMEEYLQADRSGRGRPLSQQQRQQVWQLFEVFQQHMRKESVCLFSERYQQSLINASPAYDYVFIDEAQDLKPTAIRFCISLCKNPKNVFLTADTNQSIYGNGLSWSRVAQDLRFQGRARILWRNYRTTAENWKAIQEIMPKSDNADQETLTVKTVYRGSLPILARHSNVKSRADRLNSYLHEVLLKERVSPGCAAILCPTKTIMNQIIQEIDPKFNARAMNSEEMDLNHQGVKILTMHAAKGLQFPVVAVVGVDAGILPLPADGGIDDSEHDIRQRRLFFVACSRAMRRLIVFANRKRPSPFIAGLSNEHWKIEDI